MNFANKLTLLRVFTVPVFVLFFYLDTVLPCWNLIALTLFILAGVTDIWDGRYARKHGLVTDFGKLMDPMADKLLTSTAFILLTAKGCLPAILTVVFIARDLVISAFRLIALEKGVVIAAVNVAKYKTLAQDLAIGFLLHGFSVAPLMWVGKAFSYIALVLTVWSLAVYLIKNKGLVSSK